MPYKVIENKNDCCFCGYESNRETVEHVFPKWLLEYAYSGQVAPSFYTDSDDNIKMVEMDEHLLPACYKCNNKRWSSFEGRAKKSLIDLIERGIYTDTSLETLFCWLDKSLSIGWQYVCRRYDGHNPCLPIHHYISNWDSILWIFPTWEEDDCYYDPIRALKMNTGAIESMYTPYLLHGAFNHCVFLLYSAPEICDSIIHASDHSNIPIMTVAEEPPITLKSSHPDFDTDSALTIVRFRKRREIHNIACSSPIASHIYVRNKDLFEHCSTGIAKAAVRDMKIFTGRLETDWHVFKMMHAAFNHAFNWNHRDISIYHKDDQIAMKHICAHYLDNINRIMQAMPFETYKNIEMSRIVDTAKLANELGVEYKLFPAD